MVTANDGSLLDGHGNPSDWIELQNRGREAVDLAGWFLTDDLGDRRKWMFPQTILAPGQCWWSSPRGRPACRRAACRGFGLGAGGEPVALVWRDGETLVSVYDPVPALAEGAPSASGRPSPRCPSWPPAPRPPGACPRPRSKAGRRSASTMAPWAWARPALAMTSPAVRRPRRPDRAGGRPADAVVLRPGAASPPIWR
ncbi:MAG: lamin tail domain-containing protein [bacterium]